MTKFAGVLALTAGLLACEAREIDVSGAAEGGGCGGVVCDVGLVCAAFEDSSQVCAAPVEIHGRVIDAASEAAIAGARVHGQDSGGSAPGAVAVSDADGRYVLSLGVPRTAAGAPAAVTVTLAAFAAGHRPFPEGLRVALPIAVGDAVFDEERGAYVVDETANTTIALVDSGAGGAKISGTVGGDAPGGTMVVAEGATSVYGLADVDGTYTLFDVPAGQVTVRGVRRGTAFVARSVEVEDEDLAGVDLAVDAMSAPGTVRGSVMLVDPGAGEATSVVLVPASLFDEELARGPVPFGLRAPEPGRAPDVAGEFVISGVPAGTYRVLAGFENDELVRDPDVSVGGTMVPEVEVKAGAEAMAGSFKVTGALAVVGPGRDGPELVTGAPVLRFASDPGADHYLVWVFDEFGVQVWISSAAKTMGGEDVMVPYAGPLTPGTYYQFRAVSVKDKEDTTALSTTEDLRGVFIAG